MWKFWDRSTVRPLRPEFKQIYEIAKKCRVECVIAGGAVADFDKASDVDVFLLDSSRTARFLVALDPFESVNHPYTLRDDGSFLVIGVGHPSWCPKPVQVILKTAITVHELLRSFDLSVHQWAVMPNGTVVGTDTSTLPGQMIRVNRWDEHTFGRLAKMYQRYGCSEVA